MPFAPALLLFPPKTHTDSDISEHRSECCLSHAHTLLPSHPLSVYWIRVRDNFYKKQHPYLFWNKQSIISSLSEDFPGNMSHYIDASQVPQELCKARTSSVVQWLDLFRMDWLDLLVVQGTLKSLLQHHSSKASVLQHSDFL